MTFVSITNILIKLLPYTNLNFICFKLYNFLWTRITNMSFNDRGQTISDKRNFLSVFLFADLENSQKEGH